jgi:fructose-specific phosphotransferase system IIC component
MPGGQEVVLQEETVLNVTFGKGQPVLFIGRIVKGPNARFSVRKFQQKGTIPVQLQCIYLIVLNPVVTFVL